jgi:hypothetical protein
MDKTIHCVILCCPGKDFCVGYPRYELNCDPVDTVDKMKTDYWRLWEEYDLDTNPKMRHEVMRGSSFDDDVHGMFMQQQDRMVLFDIHKPVIAQIHGNCLAREWCRSSAWQLRSMRVVTSLAGSASRGSRKGGRAALSPPLLRNATRGSWMVRRRASQPRVASTDASGGSLVFRAPSSDLALFSSNDCIPYIRPHAGSHTMSFGL